MQVITDTKALEPTTDPIAHAGVNLAGIARWAARQWPGRTALETENGEHLTFSELAARVAGLAEQLQHRRVRAGDIVAVCLDNCSTFPLLTLAAAHLGASVVPMNPGFTDAELDHILGLIKPTHIVALAEYSGVHYGTLTAHGVLIVPFQTAVPDTEPPLEPADAGYDQLGSSDYLDEPVRFGLTSGSTGVPKAVTKTQRQWLLDGRAIATLMDLGPNDRVLSAQPLYYGDPFMILMACLQSGATAIFLSRFRSQTFMENVARRGITKFMTIGAMPAMLMNTPASASDSGHHAVAAWSVGIPRHLHQGLEERFGVPWLELYGTSETGVIMAQVQPDARAVGEGWLGHPMPGHEIRLIDDNGEKLDGDGIGMLEVRGPTVTREYYRRPDATAESFLPGGWYRPGDVMERQGTQYRYLNRRKDIVRRAGENISCQEVEAALRQQEGVVDAAVIPRPDPVRGEEVWAFVQMSETPADTGTARQRAEIIVSSARESLTRHKLPRFVSFIENFERTPSERIVKRRLAAIGDSIPTCDLGERR